MKQYCTLTRVDYIRMRAFRSDPPPLVTLCSSIEVDVGKCPGSSSSERGNMLHVDIRTGKAHGKGGKSATASRSVYEGSRFSTRHLRKANGGEC